MPRLNSVDEVFKALRTAQAFRLATSSPGSTVTTADATAGATAVTVSAVTNFQSADPIFISGSGGVELNAVQGTPTAPTMVLQYKLGKDQLSGATVREAVASNLLKLADTGLSISPSFRQVPIFSATDTNAIGYFQGDAEMSASFGLLGLNGLNWQLAFGVPEAEIGTGTAADPYQVHIGGSDIGAQGLQCLRFGGIRYDDKTWQVDFMDAKVEAGGAVTFARNQPAVIPVTIKFSRFAFRYW